MRDGTSESLQAPEIGGYEHLLSVQQHQHALVIEQKDAEIAHLKARMLASEEHAPLPESLVAILQTKDEECALMMAAKHKELEFLASLLQMREHQIEELQLHPARSLSVYPYQCPGQEENQEVLKEVQHLRLRMEDLEAAVTEQQDRCNGLASELHTKAQHAQALEQYICSLKDSGIEGQLIQKEPNMNGRGAREDLHSPSVEIFASPSASSQVESYSSAIRREEPDAAGVHSTGRQSQELLREMRRLRQQMNELERAAGREAAEIHSFNAEPLQRPDGLAFESNAKDLSGWEYRAHSHDPVDAAVAELVNGRYRPWRALLCRLEQGVYLCGTRRVRIRVDAARTQLEASEDGETWADLAEVMGKTAGLA